MRIRSLGGRFDYRPWEALRLGRSWIARRVLPCCCICPAWQSTEQHGRRTGQHWPAMGPRRSEKRSLMPCCRCRENCTSPRQETRKPKKPNNNKKRETGMQIYFCEPRSPWQRGTNENTNGLLRQYFPKGTDLARYGAAELTAVTNALNNRPRKVLGWRTPVEAFTDHLSSCGYNSIATTG